MPRNLTSIFPVSALPGCWAIASLFALWVCHSDLTCFSPLLCGTGHKAALLPKERVSLAADQLGILVPSWHPFPLCSCTCQAEKSREHLLGSLALAQLGLQNKRCLHPAQTHCVTKKHLNKGRWRLISGRMEVNLCLKESHREGEAVNQLWAGQGYRGGTVQVLHVQLPWYCLVTSLWQELGGWGRTGGHHSLLAGQPYLPIPGCSLLHFFFSGVEWAKWSFFQYVSCKATAQANKMCL